jgi:hypothetical protein
MLCVTDSEEYMSALLPGDEETPALSAEEQGNAVALLLPVVVVILGTYRRACSTPKITFTVINFPFNS